MTRSPHLCPKLKCTQIIKVKVEIKVILWFFHNLGQSVMPHALPIAQIASVFSLLFFTIWISLGSESITAFQEFFKNNFSFKNGTEVLTTPNFTVSENQLIPPAETLSNNLKTSLQYKIQHWFNLVALIFFTIKTVGSICCCHLNKKFHISVSTISTITSFIGLIIFTNVRVPAYFIENTTIWLYVIAWLSVVFQVFAGITAVFLRGNLVSE